MASSMMERPRDQTSEDTVYVPMLLTDSPFIRSGYKRAPSQLMLGWAE